MDKQDLSMMKGDKRVKGRNGRAAGIFAVAVVAVGCILVTASGSPTLEAAAADVTLTPWAYLPFVRRQQPPTPYNLSAESIVLQLSDMPSGYALDEDESGRVEFSDELLQMGAVDGYEVTYINYDLFFTGTPVVYNLAIVFRTTDGARSYIQQVRQNIIDDPEGTLVSCPTLGDETVAGRSEAEDGSYVAYVIAFRKGNLAAGIGTGGLLGVAKFSDALSFARKALERINDQTGASVRATGRGGKRPETVAESAPSWVSVGASQHIRDLWAVLWMSDN